MTSPTQNQSVCQRLTQTVSHFVPHNGKEVLEAGLVATAVTCGALAFGFAGFVTFGGIALAGHLLNDPKLPQNPTTILKEPIKKRGTVAQRSPITQIDQRRAVQTVSSPKAPIAHFKLPSPPQNPNFKKPSALVVPPNLEADIDSPIEVYTDPHKEIVASPVPVVSAISSAAQPLFRCTNCQREFLTTNVLGQHFCWIRNQYGRPLKGSHYRN